MRNKSKNMYGRLAAILLTVVLLTAGLSCTALAAGENILSTIQGFDPTFESYAVEGENGEITYTKPAEASGSAITIGAGHESATSLKLGTVDDIISFMAPVEPEKNYTFSFWMKNSKPGSLQLQRGAFGFINPDEGNKLQRMVNRSERFDWMIPNKNGYIGTNGSSDKYFTPAHYTFGIERKDGAENIWRKVSINFSTPREAVVDIILNLACVVEDPMLAVDDLTLVETPFDANFIFNGNLEALREDGDIIVPFGIEGVDGNTMKIVQEPNNSQNHCVAIKLEEKADGSENKSNSMLLTPETALIAKGKKFGTRYKFSFKAKIDVDKGTKAVAIQFRRGPSNKLDSPEFGLGNVSTEWKTFTLYLDATKLAEKGITFDQYVPWFVRRGSSYYTMYVDDLYAYWDNSNIGFYETLELLLSGDNRYKDFSAPNYMSDYTEELADIAMCENGKEASSLSALPLNGDGTRTVKVRAHYLPEPKWGTDDQGATTVAFDKKEVTLLSAVYTYEKDERDRDIKKLVNVSVASGTSENGETIDVVDEITVPAGDNYWVEAMAWDMDGMKPIMEKTELRYGNK